MTGPGSAVSFTLEEFQRRIREIVGRRLDFPAPEAVEQTGGPSVGRSAEFAAWLDAAAKGLGEGTKGLSRQLVEIEQLLALTGEDLAATDDAVAADVNALQTIADSVVTPPAPGSGFGASAPAGGVAPTNAGSSATSGSDDADAATTFG